MIGALKRWWQGPARCPKILGKGSQCIHDENHTGRCHIDANQMALEMELALREQGRWDPNN